MQNACFGLCTLGRVYKFNNLVQMFEHVELLTHKMSIIWKNIKNKRKKEKNINPSKYSKEPNTA